MGRKSTTSLGNSARSWPVFLISFALFSSLGILWCLATPIFGSPDESAHATKAVAQVRGEFVGHNVDGLRFPAIDLPDAYRYNDGIVCFVPHPDVPANCGVELGSPNGTTFFGNWVLSYNPLYYYLVGWPTLLLDGNTGVYAMRILSAILNALLLALTCQAALARGSRRWMPLGLAFLASPMVMFLSGSVNPQGTEIAAGALSWIALLRLFEFYRDGVGSAAWRVWLPVIVGALFLTQARALGPLWWLATAAVALLVVGFRSIRTTLADKRGWPWIAAIAVFAIFSIGWTLFAGTLSGQATNGDAPLVGGSVLDGFLRTLRNTPAYVEEAIGDFGWLDTQLPGLVLALYLSAVFVAVLFAVLATGRQGRLGMAITLAVAALLPPIVQGAAVARTGLIWQGRYSLFLYLGVAIVAAWILSSRGDRRVDFLSVGATTAVASVLAIYHVAAFTLVLRRYVVGNAQPLTEMFSHPAWQPPFGWPGLVACLIVVMSAFTLCIVLAARRLWRLEERSPALIETAR